MVDSAATIWRDYATPGVPSSGAHMPDKAKIREWGQNVEGATADFLPSAKQFGASAAATPAENRQAINDLIDYLATNNLKIGRIGGPFEVDASISVDVDGLVLHDANLQASVDFTVDTPVLSVTGDDVVLYNPVIEGTKRAAGILLDGRAARIWNPDITHFSSYGLKIQGAGDQKVFGGNIVQYQRADAEFANDANFDGDGLVINVNDSKVFGLTVNYVGRCFYADSSCNTANLFGCHFFNGRPSGDAGGQRVDPVLFENHASSGAVFFHNCYFDNGGMNVYSPSVRFLDCNYLLNSATVTFSDDIVVRVYANGSTAPFQFMVADLFSGSSTIGGGTGSWSLISFVDNGANSWGGDYDSINAALSDASYERVNVLTGQVFVQARSATDVPMARYMKPANAVNFDYTVGTGGTTRGSWTENGLQVNAGVSTTFLQLGGAANGVKATSAGVIEVHSGASHRWNFVNNGNLTPAVNGTQQLGAAGVRLSEIFATNGAINTSDSEDKDWQGPISNAELSVAKALAKCVGLFRWQSAIASKGDAARIHAGVRAQDVQAAFDAEGLDGFRYGVLCFDEWDEIPPEYDDDGNITYPGVPAGSGYGIRYDELWAWVAAGFDARLADLEA